MTMIGSRRPSLTKRIAPTMGVDYEEPLGMSSSCEPPLPASSKPYRQRRKERSSSLISSFTKRAVRRLSGLRLSASSSTSFTPTKRVRFDPVDVIVDVQRYGSSGNFWWKPEELSIVEDVDCSSPEAHLINAYYQNNDDFYHAIASGVDVDTTALSLVAQGLDAGYRGLERWSDSGRYRRIRAKAIVYKVIEEQHQAEDLPQLCESLTKTCRIWAQVSAQADAAVAV